MLAVTLVVLSGCDDTAGSASVAQGAPPPATAAQVQAQFEAVLAPLFAMAAAATPDTPVAPGLAQEYIARLNEVRAKVSTSPAYSAGVTKVVHRLEDTLRVAREAQNGPLVLLLCDIVKYFEPGNARVPRFENWGAMVKNRPVVNIRGWYEPRDTAEPTIYAFLEVFTPEDGKTHHVEVREGEEFLNLRFEKIIGNKAGIRIVYLVTGDVIELYSASWRRRQL
ncbi:MAG TPA: hypothetical protein PLJ47_11620 [Candidatus Hydrogenedentes bacterium]|nr:hypothetical protein [Candidatus Hydrogenedentota bacterium]